MKIPDLIDIYKRGSIKKKLLMTAGLLLLIAMFITIVGYAVGTKLSHTLTSGSAKHKQIQNKFKAARGYHNPGLL